MPEFTRADRNMIEAENTLWNVDALLCRTEHEGAFKSRFDALRDAVESLASDMREYNDQFEKEE